MLTPRRLFPLLLLSGATLLFPALSTPATTMAATAAVHPQRPAQAGAHRPGASPATSSAERRSGAMPNAANPCSIPATHPTICRVHRAASDGTVLTVSGTGFTLGSGAVLTFSLSYPVYSSLRSTGVAAPTTVYTSTIHTSMSGRVTVFALGTCWTMNARVSIADSASHRATGTTDVPSCSASTYASQPTPANAIEAISQVRPMAPDICDLNAAHPHVCSVAYGGDPNGQGSISVTAVGFAAKQHVHFHLSGGDFGTLDFADVADDLGILFAQSTTKIGCPTSEGYIVASDARTSRELSTDVAPAPCYSTTLPGQSSGGSGSHLGFGFAPIAIALAIWCRMRRRSQ